MKRFVLCILILTTAISAGLCRAHSVRRVSDSTRSISVDLPSGWTQSRSGLLGTKMLLMGPTIDAFRININLMTERAPGISLSQYRKATELNAPRILNGYKYVSGRPTMLGGVPAREMVYEAEMGTPSKSLKFKAVYAIRNGTAYTLTFSSMKSTYDANVRAFDSTVNSLKWISEKPKHRKSSHRKAR